MQAATNAINSVETPATGLLKTAEPVTIPFKQQGRTVMLLGGLGDCDATHFGGTCHPENPGPGDLFDQLGPVDLGD